MLGKQTDLPPVASRFFRQRICVLLVTLPVAFATANDLQVLDGLGPVGRTSQNEFLITLSGHCTITTFRLSEMVAVTKFDGGWCDDLAAVRSPHQASMYVSNREGVITTLSLPDLKVSRRVSVDQPISQLLISTDERYLIAVGEKGKSSASLLVLHGNSLTLARSIPLTNRLGKALKVARLVELVHRQSVLITFNDANEMWELFLAPDKEMVFEGMVHDYRLGEGISEPRKLPMRRIALDSPMDHFLVEPRSAHLWQFLASGAGATRARRFNLDVRSIVGEILINAELDPNAGSELTSIGLSFWMAADRDWPGVSIHELPGMQSIGTIAMPGDRCRPLAAPTGRSVHVATCSTEEWHKLFVIDAATSRLRAILQPRAEVQVTQIVSGGTGWELIAVLPGEAGLLVAYGPGYQCRSDEIAVQRLRRVVN